MTGTTSRAGPAVPGQPTIHVVDDDESLREALSSLFRSVGMQVVLHASAPQLLARPPAEGPSCIVLDIRLPGVSGFEFQGQLARAGLDIPIIFMTGHGDIPMSVRAMKAGAVDFLTKPFRDQDMLDAVNAAIERDRQRRSGDRVVGEAKANYDTLTAREKEVMALVVTGLMNKQIAGELDLSEITVKIHRGRLMKKMAARTLPDLVRMAGLLGIGKPG